MQTWKNKKKTVMALIWTFQSSCKVDEANVDTSSFVESISWWIWALEAWALLAIVN